MSFNFFCHNIALINCTITYPAPGDTIYGEIVISLDQTIAVPSVNYDVVDGGVFGVNGQYVICNPGHVKNSSTQAVYYSADNGATFTAKSIWPTVVPPGGGNRSVPASRMQWDSGSSKWRIYTYWEDNRWAAIWSNDLDLSGTYVRTPLPSVSYTNSGGGTSSATTNEFGRGGFVVDGSGNFVHFSQNVPNGTDPNWLGIMRRDFATGSVISSTPVLSNRNSGALFKIGTRYLGITSGGASERRDMYYFDSSITTWDHSFDSTINVSATNSFASNGLGTVLCMKSGLVYRWTAPTTAAVFPSETLPGRSVSSSVGRIWVKPYVWLFVQVINNSRNVRIWHSTNEDGSGISSSYVTMVIPTVGTDNRPQGSGDYTQLAALEDGYWLLSYLANDKFSHVVRFQYEIPVGNCTNAGFIG